MIRASKIKELINDKVAILIDQELSKIGFKYQKAKQKFIRKINGINQTLYINTQHSPLSYNDDTDQLFLTFNVFYQLEIPDYENWYLEKIGDNIHFSYRIDSLTSQIELSHKDVEKESFYVPTASQKFKGLVAHSFVQGGRDKIGIIPMNDFLENTMPNIISNLTAESDILTIYNNTKQPFSHIFILMYGGYINSANEQFAKYHNFLIENIENKLKISEVGASGYIEELNKLIKNIQKVSSLVFSNPYSRSIKIVSSLNDHFEFSTKTHFHERLRLDISQFDIKTVSINSVGEILLFVDNQRIIKINARGETILDLELELKKGFDKIFYGVPVGIISGTNDFFVNNFIIKSTNQILELALPIQKLKKGKLQNPTVSDLIFWDKTNQYLVVYEDNFIKYNIEGQVDKTLTIQQKQNSKIIIEKEWIVTQNRNVANVVLDFEGNIVGTYEFGNGNNNYEFSTNQEQLICFFYSTKSQFYDLINKKKETIWAHPTYLKDYKEKMYNDTNHNFGLQRARFSPDNKYIVGGGDHGKYVAWTLPKLERFELIPVSEMIELLEPQISIEFCGEEVKRIITKAEIVVLEKKEFLKNRNNEITKILFFEKGDTFITELSNGKFVLSWDRNFTNLTYKKIDGSLDFHSDKYLTQKTSTDLIIYEQK